MDFSLKHPQRTADAVERFKGIWTANPDNICLHSTQELECYYEIASGFHDKSDEGYIVNAGVFHGASTCIFGIGQRNFKYPDRPIIAIDFFYGSGGDENYIKSVSNFDSCGIGNRICLVRFDDCKFFESFSIPTRIVLVDTNHEYVHVSRILPNVLANMTDGSWIIVHDYTEESPGTIKAVDEFMAGHEFELFQVDKSVLIRIRK